MESKGFIESRWELRTDPIVPTQKDYMRMWAVQLPSLQSVLASNGEVKK